MKPGSYSALALNNFLLQVFPFSEKFLHQFLKKLCSEQLHLSVVSKRSMVAVDWIQVFAVIEAYPFGTLPVFLKLLFEGD